ncbi:MAG: hypothetical protein QOJ70_2181 [Acidobacteriota bacterium]|jgi:hypothetical protein|nr:hypothetical protein [Acidobacteriota bacterium]
MRKKLLLVLAHAASLAALMLFCSTAARAQDAAKPKTDAPKTSTAKVDEKALAVVTRGVEALGGRAYTDVRTIVSHGYLTQFREGTQGIPVTFHDYMVYPDHERTEFKGAGVRSVQVNTGETGWLFEGKAKKLTDVTPEQAEDFRVAMRTSVDNLLRGWWRAGGAGLTYVGRREAGLARRNEVVRLSYPDGFEAEFEFDAREGLPAKVVYKRQNAEGETVEEEDRYAQFQQIGGAFVPFIIDHYRAGTQSSRVNYDEVEFNRPIPDSLFAKPADVKAIKF